jgi:hypothetical protein
MSATVLNTTPPMSNDTIASICAAPTMRRIFTYSALAGMGFGIY